MISFGKSKFFFVNPITGQTYSASQTWDGKSIAFEFLSRLNTFVDNDWRPAKEAYQLVPNANNTDEFERIDRQMNEFIEMVDYLREMRRMVDFAQGGGLR